MDISDIPDSPVVPIESTREHPRRHAARQQRRGSEGGNREERDEPVEVRLSDEALKQQAVLDLATRLVLSLSRTAGGGESALVLARRRGEMERELDRWAGGSPGSAAAVIAESILRSWPPDVPAGRLREIVASEHRESVRALRVSGAGPAIEDYVGRIVGSLLDRIGGAGGPAPETS